MVLYSTDKPSLYRELGVLEDLAERHSPGHVKLHFHNFVNNADLVPRLLGTSLDSVHNTVERFIPSMKVNSFNRAALISEAFSYSYNLAVFHTMRIFGGDFP